MKITFLGMGAMGSRMAKRLEDAGHIVLRWNRSGATQTPREASTDADVIIAMVRDDKASKAVWLGGDGALAGMKSAALAIESSTLSVEWVNALAGAMTEENRSFIDAPVLGSRPQAEAGQLVHLIGGDADLAERAIPVLSAIGGAQLHAGPIGSGTALKLIGNALFAIQVTALAELLGHMPTLGLDPATAIEQLGNTPLLSPAAKGAANLMLANRHEPMFPVELVAKDLNYGIGDAMTTMPVAAAARAVFEKALGLGLGEANLTAVAQLYRGCRQ